MGLETKCTQKKITTIQEVKECLAELNTAKQAMEKSGYQCEVPEENEISMDPKQAAEQLKMICQQSSGDKANTFGTKTQ